MSCPAPTTNISWIVFGVLAAVAACVYLIRSSLHAKNDELMSKFKIIISAMQMNMIASSLEVAWPSPLDKVFQVNNAIVGAGSSVVSVSCQFLKAGVPVFYGTVVMVASLPALAVLVPALVLGVGYCYQARLPEADPGALKRDFVGYFSASVAVVVFLVSQPRSPRITRNNPHNLNTATLTNT